MPQINRKSSEDAENVIDKFIKDDCKDELLTFLSNAIIYANGLNRRNWNLNLDKNGGFVRFNVGHEYCIEIFKDYVSILTLKKCLKKKLKDDQLDIEFKGYNGKHKIITKDFNNTPDCLVKVPGSVACHVKHDNALATLPYLEEANRQFIAYAINNTLQLPSMNKAHSPGLISYLSNYCAKQIPNPEYISSEDKFYRIQEHRENEARKLIPAELLERIKHDNNSAEATRVNIVGSRFKRDPYIAQYAKKRAKGICQECKQPAPFRNKATQEPFLEVHHKISLADGGKDTIENTIALCPNCHRKMHYGE